MGSREHERETRRQCRRARVIVKIAFAADLEIRRVIYGLLQAGLVEIVRPGGATLTNQRMFPTTNKEEQKSLVNRLINRIRSI